MSPKNARVHLVHLAGEPDAQPRRLSGESPALTMGTRVLVELSPGYWRRGHVDHRAPSGPGGVTMVTLDH